MPIITVDVETDYTHQFQPGVTLHSASGFIIGMITDSVVDHSGEDTQG